MSTGWFPEAGDGPTGLLRVAGHRPAYAAALSEVLDAIWDQDVLETSALELCRLRIGHLLGAKPEPVPGRVDPDVAAALSQWPTDDRFNPRLRTILGYAELLLVDAQEIDDDQAQRVIDAIGEDGFLVLTYACGVFETTQRAEVILGRGRKPS